MFSASSANPLERLLVVGSTSSAGRGYRDRWPFLIGLAFGIGIATVIHTFTMSSNYSNGINPFSFASTPSIVSKKGKRPKILLYGDSLTQRGYDVDAYGWAAALANIYSRRADVVNRGFSGYTSKWCALMLDSLFPFDDPLWEIPVLAIIFLGANDASLPSREQHVPVSEYQVNLKKIINHFKRRGPSTQILLLSPPPVDEVRWGLHCQEKGRELDRKNEVTHLYVKGCQAVGAQMKIPVVDLWTLLGGNDAKAVKPNLIDGLHLASRGNSKLIEAVMDAIRDELRGVSPEDLPMQAPEHFELESTTRSIRF